MTGTRAVEALCRTPTILQQRPENPFRLLFLLARQAPLQQMRSNRVRQAYREAGRHWFALAAQVMLGQRLVEEAAGSTAAMAAEGLAVIVALVVMAVVLPVTLHKLVQVALAVVVVVRKVNHKQTRQASDLRPALVVLVAVALAF